MRDEWDDKGGKDDEDGKGIRWVDEVCRGDDVTGWERVVCDGW